MVLLLLALAITSAPLLASSPSDPATPSSSFTTVADQITWNDSLTSATPDFICLQTTIALPSPAPENPYAIIGLAEAGVQAPAYTVNISYNKTTNTYALFGTKRSASGPLQNLIVQSSTNPVLWSVLESWRSGTPQAFTLVYAQGTFILSSQNVIAWGYQDQSPITGITRVALASSKAPLTYSNVAVTGALPSTIGANAIAGIPLSANQSFITFKTTALPETITCGLYSQPTDVLPSYALEFSTANGISIKLTHHSSSQLGSDIPNTNGAYQSACSLVPAPEQTYFISYKPQAGKNTIAFGLLPEGQAAQVLLSWSNPKITSDNMTLCALRSSAALTSLSYAPATTDIPSSTTTLGLVKQNSTYRATGLGASASCKQGSLDWDNYVSFPVADQGAVQCDLQLTAPEKTGQNGAVLLLSNQAHGQALYGIFMEPQADASSSAGSTATRARFRLCNFNGSEITALGDPLFIDGHTLQGTYRIVYQNQNNVSANVYIYQVTTSPQLLGTLSIKGPSSGIKYAAFSCLQAPVAYSNVVCSNLAADDIPARSTSTPAASSGTSAETTTSHSTQTFETVADGFDTIVRARQGQETLPASFAWDHSALQQTVDQANGFSLQTTALFKKDAPERVIVLGLSPQTIDPTKIYQFNMGGQLITNAFAGAAQLIIITISADAVSFARVLPSPSGTSSPFAAQKKVVMAIDNGPLTIWLNYLKTNTTQAVSVGLNSTVGTSPLFSWQDTRNAASDDIAKIGLSSWLRSDVAFTDIQFSAIGDQSTAQTSTTPQTAAIAPTPNSLVRDPNSTKDYESKLIYNWDLGKTEDNQAGSLDDQCGGFISALVTVTKPDSEPKATFMIGFSSNPAGQQSMKENKASAFAGAEYNIQFQARQNDGYISMRRPTTKDASDFDGANFATTLKALMAFDQTTSVYPTKKLWARYTPQQNQRLFEAGMVDTTNTDDIATLTPLWSWTDATTTTSAPPLHFASISAWGISCTITNVIVGKNKAETTGGREQATQAADGTLSAANLPLESQWTLNAFSIKPNTEHSLVISGGADRRAVVALSPEIPSPSAIACSLVFSQDGITLYDAAKKNVASSVSGGLTSDAQTYLLSASSTALTLSGQNADGSKTTYITWNGDALKAAKTVWYAAYGATSTVQISYQGGVVQTNTTGAGNATVVPVIRSRPAAARAAITTRATALQQTVPTSAQLAAQRYRVNVPISARTAQ